MPHTDNLYYEFGPYRLSMAQRLLTRSGEIISLSRKATDILVLLVSNAGQLVDKDDLLKEVWPDTFVEEANLTQNIFTLRRALGDERADPKYIETVARRGYRFIAGVKVFEDESTETPDGADNGDIVSPRPVVAVLPFLNATGDPGLEYLAEGVTDNIINNLSRISKLRVMSRSAVFRHKREDFDAQLVGKELCANAVLVGKINSRPSGIAIGVELVDVSTGWQLWGESFDSESKDLLQIQDAITRRVLETLKLKLTGEEEKRVTARYTENAAAYQAYLEGRYHWSKYTRNGIEQAINHFREAIEVDPNYALAYAGIIDCYLRLATNYLPPEELAAESTDDTNLSAPVMDSNKIAESDSKVKLRFEWDWKGAERELRRASELKTQYPAAHQWYAAYQMAQQIFERSQNSLRDGSASMREIHPKAIPGQIAWIRPTISEQIQVYCAIAREQIDVGNYEAACRILQSWWQFGEWPNVEGLNQQNCADFLFTVGDLAGCVASTKQLQRGQKHGEALLNGSIAIFEQLGSRRRADEGRIELALCYHRQGLFDLARSMLVKVLNTLAAEDSELRSLALIRLASLERHAGRFDHALSYLNQARAIMQSSGPWVTGRCHLELASTYKELAHCKENASYFERAQEFYLKALQEFEAVGNHRLAAIVENNLGYLLLSLDKSSQAESHLLRARQIFDYFEDQIRCAQVDDTLARLYFAQGNLTEARIAIERSVQTMENCDEDAFLAESLTTKGIVYCALKRYNEAQKALDGACRLASRCGDKEGAGRALLILVEEMRDMLELEELHRIRTQLVELLSTSQQPTIRDRLGKCLKQ